MKRNTIWPRQDFAVIPLTEMATKLIIMPAIGGNVPRKLVHIQIEKAGILEFGAYDNLQSIFFGASLTQEVVPSLVARGS